LELTNKESKPGIQVQISCTNGSVLRGRILEKRNDYLYLQLYAIDPKTRKVMGLSSQLLKMKIENIYNIVFFDPELLDAYNLHNLTDR